jgi:hypothetical protein
MEWTQTAENVWVAQTGDFSLSVIQTLDLYLITVAVNADVIETTGMDTCVIMPSLEKAQQWAEMVADALAPVMKAYPSMITRSVT